MGALRSPAGEVLEVDDRFAHALRPLGWEPVSGSKSASSAPRRRSARSKKSTEPAPDETEEG